MSKHASPTVIGTFATAVRPPGSRTVSWAL